MKKILFGLISLFVVVALVACRIQTVEPGPDRIFEWQEVDQGITINNRPVTINYFHRMGGTNEAQLRQWVEEFTGMFPNITVNIVHTGGGYDDLQQRVLLELGTANNDANMPDVMESYPDHILTYVPSGRPMALNNLLTAPNISALFTDMTPQEDWLDITRSFRDGQQIDNSAPEGAAGHNADFEITGTIASLPFIASTEMLIYNRLLLEEQGWTLPTTWEGFNELAPSILEQITPDTASELHRGQPVFPIGYDSTGNWFITGMMQWGAPYIADRWALDDDGNFIYDEEGELVALIDEDRVVFNNPQAHAMVTFFANMVRNGFKTTRALSAVNFLSAVFVQGRLFSSIGSTAGLRNSVTNVAITNRVVAGVAPLPHFEGKQQTQIQQGGNISMFYNGCEDRMVASWMLMQYLTSTDRAAEWVTAYNHPIPNTGAPGNIPYRTSVIQSQAWYEWSQDVVRFPDLSQTEIPAADILSWPIADRENRIAFDAMIASLSPDVNFYVTPAFRFSSNMRTEATPLMDAIMSFALIGGPNNTQPTPEALQAFIVQRFGIAYNQVLGL